MIDDYSTNIPLPSDSIRSLADIGFPKVKLAECARALDRLHMVFDYDRDDKAGPHNIG